jgi:cytochrome b
MGEAHEFFTNATLGLVFIYIMGIIFESFLYKENLSKAILIGYKGKPDQNDNQQTGE